MRAVRQLAALVFTAFAGLGLQACGGGEKYLSVAGTGMTLELKSGGVAVISMPGLPGSSGTYTIDGEKILLSVDGQTHTLLKTGNCVEDALNVFDRMCLGGKADEAASAPAAAAPGADGPSGTWRATSEQGEFTLEFKPGNTLTLTLSATGGPTETHPGTFSVDGREIHARLEPQGDPLVLTFVNDAYETTSFGFPLKFVKQ